MDTIKKISTSLPGVVILEPRVFSDERGFFLESYNQKAFAELGIDERFVQDNHSSSRRNVLRGLHYQIKHAQGKLVRAVEGEIATSPRKDRVRALRLVCLICGARFLGKDAGLLRSIAENERTSVGPFFLRNT